EIGMTDAMGAWQDTCFIGVSNDSGGVFAGYGSLLIQSRPGHELVFGTGPTDAASVEARIRIPYDAAGLQFPATQQASTNANTLDDYEEGTWTISATFGGASTLQTASASAGTYEKIGRQVRASARLKLTEKGSATGDAALAGLPFAIGGKAYASLWLETVTFADFPMGSGGSSVVSLYESTNAGVVTALTEGDFADTSEADVSVSYSV
ncbi:MAG: hypothetical protein ACTS5I_07455, partial [Rhodanobacter sp.]